MLNLKRKAAYKKGVAAEGVAADYFKALGFEILKQRYKTKVGEIDLIVQKDRALIFVEVKSHADISASLYAVTERPRRRIEQAALHFIAENPQCTDFEMRFDVVAVPETMLCADGRADAHNLLGSEGVQHLDNAWLAGQ